MNDPNEQMQILKMVEAGQISAEEAVRLLKALDKVDEKMHGAAASASTARWFRVRVTDLATGKYKVNVNIPIGLVSVGMRLGAKFAPNVCTEEMDQILNAVKSGAQGRIIDVEDVEDGERVEIYVE
jgi:hypothetical protein